MEQKFVGIEAAFNLYVNMLQARTPPFYPLFLHSSLEFWVISRISVRCDHCLVEAMFKRQDCLSNQNKPPAWV